MTAKQAGGLQSPDGSYYVTLTDGAGNLSAGGGGAVTQSGTWTVQPGNTANTTAWKVDGSAVTQPVSIASTITSKETRPTTGTQTSVASSASDVTILASNANRLGAMVYNDSTQILYLLVGSGTSSTSNYSVQVPSQGFYTLDFPAYTGVLKGIWASANGNARVTELT